MTNLAREHDYMRNVELFDTRERLAVALDGVRAVCDFSFDLWEEAAKERDAATEQVGRLREALTLADEAVRRASWFVVGHSWPTEWMAEATAAEQAFDRYRAARSALASSDSGEGQR